MRIPLKEVQRALDVLGVYDEINSAKGAVSTTAIVPGDGTGDVTGPASSVNNRIAVFDGVTGKVIKDGGRTIEEIETSIGSVLTQLNTHVSNTANPHETTLEQARSHNNQLSGDINFNNNTGINVPTPTAGNHIANKEYVDNFVDGLSWQPPVINTLSTPPGSPDTGDRYIVGESPTGAWEGREDDIAEWDGDEWIFFTPEQGWATFVINENEIHVFNGTEWISIGVPVSDHNSLTGLQGGTGGEHFHLTQAQHDAVTPAATFADGSVIFSDDGKLAQDNANFFWDEANNRLGIRTTEPEQALHVVGNAYITGSMVVEDNNIVVGMGSRRTQVDENFGVMAFRTVDGVLYRSIMPQIDGSGIARYSNEVNGVVVTRLDLTPTGIVRVFTGIFAVPTQVGIGTETPNAAASLDITSTSRGFLPPRMTATQRDAISSPPDGLVLYDTTNSKLQVRAAGAWVNLH
jgi:hypothetical protein